MHGCQGMKQTSTDHRGCFGANFRVFNPPPPPCMLFSNDTTRKCVCPSRPQGLNAPLFSPSCLYGRNALPYMHRLPSTMDRKPGFKRSVKWRWRVDARMRVFEVILVMLFLDNRIELSQQWAILSLVELNLGTPYQVPRAVNWWLSHGEKIPSRIVYGHSR